MAHLKLLNVASVRRARNPHSKDSCFSGISVGAEPMPGTLGFATGLLTTSVKRAA